MGFEGSLFKIQLVSAMASAAILTIIVGLIRQRRLLEAYALLWLGAGVSLLILSVWKGLLIWLAGIVGVSYPPALLFLVALFFSVGLFLHFSVVISRLTDQNKKLAQEIALLRVRPVDRMIREDAHADM